MTQHIAPQFKSMSPIGTWVSALFTSGISAVYWLWLQSRSVKTPRDLQLNRCVNFCAITFIVYFLYFLVFFFITIGSRSDVGLQMPAPWLLICLVCLACLAIASLYISIALLNRNLNSISEQKTGTIKIVFLTFPFLLSILSLQKRINETLQHQR